MTRLLSQEEICLTDSLISRDVVSDNSNICWKIFTSEVSEIKWLSCQTLHTFTTTIFTSCDTPNRRESSHMIRHLNLGLREKEKIWLSLEEQSFILIFEDSFKDIQALLNYSLNDESSLWVNTSTRHFSQGSVWCWRLCGGGGDLNVTFVETFYKKMVS